MKTPAQTRAVMKKLEAQHPGAQTELHFENPFQLLVATILSAQTTDERVNQATPGLFERYADAPAMAAADVREIERLIHATGFYAQKSRALVGMARALTERHGGEVPADMSALVAAARRRTQDRERGPRTRARRSRPCRSIATCCASPIASASRTPTIPRSSSSSCARRSPPTGGRDLGHADPARAAHLQAEAALRPLRRPRRLRLLPARPGRRARPRRPSGQGVRSTRHAREQKDRHQETPKTAGRSGGRADNAPRSLRSPRPDALRSIPAEFRSRIRNLAIVVEDEPGPRLLAEMDVAPRAKHCSASITARRSPSADGTTATACPTASRSSRARTNASRRRGGSRRRNRRDVDPRDRPLLRHERGRNRGDRGELLAGPDGRGGRGCDRGREAGRVTPWGSGPGTFGLETGTPPHFAARVVFPDSPPAGAKARSGDIPSTALQGAGTT